jgi:peroxiredoxin
MRTILVTTVGALVALTAFAVEVGKPSPALTIQRLSGPPLQLSQYKGKVVALAFIDTNCPHCQNLTKLLNVIAKEYEPKGAQVLGCAFNDHVQDLLPQFLKQFQPTFPVGYCDRDAVMVYVQYSVLKPFYVPHMVFLDRRGVVRGDFAGESEFMTQPDVNVRTELDQLLKGTTSTSAAAKKQ